MRHTSRRRLLASTLALAGALLSMGCQARPSVKPEPEATSLFVRNYGGLDVNVYAVPRLDAAPVWLTSVPGGETRTVALRWRDLQASGGLVVRTQVVGASKTWTSEPIIIDDGIVAVLDLTVTASRTTAGSVLRGVTMNAFNAAMR